MQRLSTAYAIGGIETLYETLAYNFGVTPSRFVLAQPGDFQWLVDDINGIDVTLFYPDAPGLRWHSRRSDHDGRHPGPLLCFLSGRHG